MLVTITGVDGSLWNNPILEKLEKITGFRCVRFNLFELPDNRKTKKKIRKLLNKGLVKIAYDVDGISIMTIR